MHNISREVTPSLQCTQFRERWMAGTLVPTSTSQHGCLHPRTGSTLCALPHLGTSSQTTATEQTQSREGLPEKGLGLCLWSFPGYCLWRIRQFYLSHILIIYKKFNDRVRERVVSHVTMKGEEQWGWKDPRCTEHKILCVTFNFNNNHERSCQRQELKCGVTTVTKWPGVAQPLCAPCWHWEAEGSPGHLPRWVTPSKNGAYRKPYRLVLKSTRAHDQVWFCAQCSLVCVCIRNSKQKEGLPFLKIKIVLSLLTEIPYLQYLVVPTFCWRIRNLSRCSRCSVSICWAN